MWLRSKSLKPSSCEDTATPSTWMRVSHHISSLLPSYVEHSREAHGILVLTVDSHQIWPEANERPGAVKVYQERYQPTSRGEHSVSVGPDSAKGPSRLVPSHSFWHYSFLSLTCYTFKEYWRIYPDMKKNWNRNVRLSQHTFSHCADIGLEKGKCSN